MKILRVCISCGVLILCGGQAFSQVRPTSITLTASGQGGYRISNYRYYWYSDQYGKFEDRPAFSFAFSAGLQFDKSWGYWGAGIGFQSLGLRSTVIHYPDLPPDPGFIVGAEAHDVWRRAVWQYIQLPLGIGYFTGKDKLWYVSAQIAPSYMLEFRQNRFTETGGKRSKTINKNSSRPKPDATNHRFNAMAELAINHKIQLTKNDLSIGMGFGMSTMNVVKGTPMNLKHLYSGLIVMYTITGRNGEHKR